jgi:3-oxoacyl-[acyl-carrier protein] reductase
MNHIDLKHRVAVVTGGAQGIGYAVSQRLLQSGASVVIWDMDAAKLQEAQTALSQFGQVSGHVVELTSDDEVAAATAKTLQASGHIDILVNNAGITGGNAPTWDLAPDVWRRVIEVNLIAPYLTCRAVTPHMVSRRWGRIINVASVAGKEGNPNASHYSASKAGVIALTKSLAKEVATQGVLVNAVAPAVAKTAMFAQMTEAHIAYMLGKIPMGRFVEVEEIAAMIACLASEDCSFTTGSVFDITGGRSTY